MTDSSPGRDPGGTQEPTDEALAVYLRFRKLFGGVGPMSRDAKKRATKKEGASVPFGLGRDPHGISDILDNLTSKLGWDSPLAQSELISSWSEIVGVETAEHSAPTSIEDGTLIVRCDSTAWATQLRLMRSQVTTQIAIRFPGAGITTVRFEGPNAPSWKRGPRSIPGRGPRDTYG